MQILHVETQPFQLTNHPIYTNNTNPHSLVIQMTTITTPKPHTTGKPQNRRNQRIASKAQHDHPTTSHLPIISQTY